MTSETIAQIRNEAAASLSPEQQQQWEQFLTPMPVAEQAVSLFTPTDRPVRILDLGSGSGILSAVVAGQSAAGSSVVAIEQDADVVMFLYRDEYYDKSKAEQSSAKVIVAKNRHGAVRNVDIGWLPQFTKFITIDKTQQEPV